jgi:hypothetical protein
MSQARDLRWKAALGLAVDHRGFHRTPLSKLRARLLVPETSAWRENALRLAEELGVLRAPAGAARRLNDDAGSGDEARHGARPRAGTSSRKLIDAVAGSDRQAGEAPARALEFDCARPNEKPKPHARADRPGLRGRRGPGHPPPIAARLAGHRLDCRPRDAPRAQVKHPAIQRLQAVGHQQQHAQAADQGGVGWRQPRSRTGRPAPGPIESQLGRRRPAWILGARFVKATRDVLPLRGVARSPSVERSPSRVHRRRRSCSRPASTGRSRNRRAPATHPAAR